MRTIINKEKNYSAEIFESVAEFQRTLKTAKVNESWRHRECQSLETGFSAENFTGTKNFEIAQNYLQKGYKKGMRQLESAKGAIKVSTVVEKNKVKLNVAGFAPCVPAAIQGKPKTMYYTKKLKRAAPVVRLFYQRAARCSVPNETIARAGANVLSLVQYLEKHGIKVELFICAVSKKQCHTRDNSVCACIIRVKSAAAALNMQLISYPMIHPSFFRRHVFRWRETSKISVGTDRYYGSTVSNAMNFLQALGILDGDSYYIDIDMAERARSIEDLLLRVGLKL